MRDHHQPTHRKRLRLRRNRPTRHEAESSDKRQLSGPNRQVSSLQYGPESSDGRQQAADVEMKSDISLKRPAHAQMLAELPGNLPEQSFLT